MEGSAMIAFETVAAVVAVYVMVFATRRATL
jgi:hypothetical protein